MEHVIQSIRTLHDEVLAELNRLPTARRSQPKVHYALLHLFQVDAEVVRNLFELFSGENTDPEMLDREDPDRWFQEGRARLADWDWAETVNRTTEVAADLANLLTTWPPTLAPDDHRVQELVRFSVDAAKGLLATLRHEEPS